MPESLKKIICKQKFLEFLHKNLDALLSDDCLNITNLQGKARKLAQFRYQDTNYSCCEELFSSICEYDAYLLRKFSDKVKEVFA